MILVKKILILVFAIVFVTYNVTKAQTIKLPSYILETGGSISTGRQSPFWLVSNQFGKQSVNPVSGFFSAQLKTTEDTSKAFDYDYGMELFDRFDGDNRFWIHQAYFKARLHFMYLRIGKCEETFGNQDELLSSGAYLFSENARPIPRIHVSTNDYVVVPFSANLVEVKGGISHGWFGEKDQYVAGAYLHHKYAHIRFGERRYRFSINLGFHHAVMWGGISPDSGKLPRNWNAFGSVIAGKMGNNTGPVNEQINSIGNHLGSYSIGVDYKMENKTLHFYWQTMLEDKNGRVGIDWKNKGDGLWGISLNRQVYSGGIQRIMLEFFNSTSQSGDPAKSGNDNYFNNYLYRSGWTYHKMTIGTPLITSAIFTNRTPDMENYLDNNSIRALIGGMIYKINERLITIRLAYTKNFGTKSLPYTPPKHQLYSSIEFDYPSLRFENLLFSWQAAFDIGSHLGNNAGLMVKIRKTF